jgi:uncharacterized protein YjiS (DUF1127 family)
MEMIMSTTFGALATSRGRTLRRTGLISTVKLLWTAFLTRHIERAAMSELRAMNDRELKDIGLTRSEIVLAVRGERDHRKR